MVLLSFHVIQCFFEESWMTCLNLGINRRFGHNSSKIQSTSTILQILCHSLPSTVQDKLLGDTPMFLWSVTLESYHIQGSLKNACSAVYLASVNSQKLNSSTQLYSVLLRSTILPLLADAKLPLRLSVSSPHAVHWWNDRTIRRIKTMFHVSAALNSSFPTLLN